MSEAVFQVCVMGIDPGVTGGIAFYFPSTPNAITAEDIPNVAGQVDIDLLVRRIEQMRPTVAVLEKVGTHSKGGAAASFKYGAAYGALRATLTALRISTHLVAPTVWKKHYRLDTDKEKSRALAKQIWPGVGHFDRKKDHGRAEAALLARYGTEVLSAAGGSLEVAA